MTRATECLFENAAARLQTSVERRLSGEPVSRILGRSGFFGLDLLVTRDVLDPRGDTELLVHCALDFVGNLRRTKARILDLGTGSGAILCALLDALPDAVGIGVDLSFPACKVAQSNLDRCGLTPRSAIICGDWADSLCGEFDVIVCNPPYIAWGERLDLDREVIKHDPEIALFGGVDGLSCYRQIARQLDRMLKPNGGAFFEIGWRQAACVRNILSSEGFQDAHIVRDAANHDRVVSFVKA